MKKYFVLTLFAVLLVALIGIKSVFAADTWYVGEGLKEGDYFRYSLCQSDYKSCAEFEMDLWVKGKTESGDWDMAVLVINGNKIVNGNMQVGRVAPEPIGTSEGLSEYASAYRSSIVWLSGFATRIDPKDFAAPAWGKIGNIGGMPVGPFGVKETVTVPAGTFETHVIGWHKSVDHKIWIKDDFPFPVKALTFVDVTQGTIPIQYKFELLEYGNTANPPDFLDVDSTPVVTAEQCPSDDSIKRGQENTDTNKMIIQYSYSPESPRQGCEITWHLDFAKSFDINQFESDVHYDIFVVDENGKLKRSFAQEQGRDHLFSPAGKELLSMEIKEPVGTAHYIIHVYGTGPDGTVPDTEKSGSLTIDVDVAKGTMIDEAPDETPADETPADETPADETPADETPADETPDVQTPKPQPKSGCLIATAAFGSEIAPQVQMLRETRDNIVMQTQSGATFMTAFNSVYYSFAPTVADWERENSVFKEIVRLAITPLITTLSILNYVDIDSEAEMLGYGISLILLNVGMYFVAPAFLIMRLKRHDK